MNGTVVQINCMNVELDDLREDEFIRHALDKANEEEAA